MDYWYIHYMAVYGLGVIWRVTYYKAGHGFSKSMKFAWQTSPSATPEQPNPAYTRSLTEPNTKHPCAVLESNAWRARRH